MTGKHEAGDPQGPVLRNDPRHNVTWRATVRCADWARLERVATLNVSKGGMFLRTESSVTVGTRAEVVLVLPDGREERLGATVRHVVAERESGPPGVGLEMDPEHHNLLAALAEIARIEQGQPAVVSSPEPAAPTPGTSTRLGPPQGASHPAPTLPCDILAIDFGVSYSRVAVSLGDRAQLVADERGRTLVPSVITFADDGRSVVGWDARLLQSALPHRTISSIKRLLGRRHSDPQIAGFLHSLPFPTTPGPDQTTLFQIGAATYAVPQLCALIIGHLRELAERRLGRSFSRAVFSHPVAFPSSYRVGLKRAAKLAGLEVLGFVEEPVAGALAYGLGQGKNEIVAVYDFGGGTFDFTVVDLSFDRYRVLTSKGDDWLGGDDFDQRIAEAAANSFWKRTNVELRGRAVEWSRLLLAAEAAKRVLATRESSRLHLTGIGASPAMELDLTLDRPSLRRLCNEFWQRSLDICRTALAEIGLDPETLTQVVLSGGTTYVPFIREGLERFFGRQVLPPGSLDPQQAVALGASLHAARLWHP